MTDITSIMNYRAALVANCNSDVQSRQVNPFKKDNKKESHASKFLSLPQWQEDALGEMFCANINMMNTEWKI